MYHAAPTTLRTGLLLFVCTCFTLAHLTTPTTLAQHPRSTRAALSDYRVIHGWPVLPEGMILGQVSGLGVDSHNHVYVFRRAEKPWSDDVPLDTNPAATVMVFEGATGNLRAAWGENVFVMPHGLTVDRKDNIWLTDVGLHQVFKFDHAGKLLFSVGERGVPGADGSHFNRPTDVAVASDGSFYVSDGYINSRIAAFSPEGRYLFEWGAKGNGPGQFDVPHGIALDPSGRIYVADRSNARVQLFDETGKYITEWKGRQIGRPWAVRAASDGYLYVVDGGDQPSAPPDRARVLKLEPKGTVVASFGRFGNYDGQLVWPHCIAIGKDGAIYVGDVKTGMRVQKFKKHNGFD